MQNASDFLTDDTRSAACRNCGTALVGEFCHACGQREREVYLADVAGETIHDLAYGDSRLWRTLRRLLFQPGRVTADYFAGRRARYIPPVRLYLFVSFLVFVLASVTDRPLAVQSASQVAGDDVAPRRGIFIPRTGEDGQREWLTLREFLDTSEMAQFRAGLPEWMQPLSDRLRRKAAALEEDPAAWSEELDSRIPHMMFLLLPVFALLLSLFYRGTSFHYMQHLIFSLHCHTVAFILFLLTWPMRFLINDPRGWVGLILLVYLPLALRRAYGSGWTAAIAKGAAISGVYFLVVRATGIVVALSILLLL